MSIPTTASPHPGQAPAPETALVGGAPAEVLDAPGWLIVTPHPVLLDGQRTIAADLQPGETLAEFLRRHVPEIDSGDWSVSIGGFEVPRLMWGRTYPKHGQLISARASVHKSALKFIAVGAVAFFTFGWVALAAVGLGAGAALIAKALKPKVPSTPTAQSGREVYSLRSQRNTARAYAPIGTLLGEMRVTPDLASQPYTWFEGDDQYLSTILLGGINVDSYSDLAVGDTPLSSYTDVTVYTNGFSGMTSQDVPLFSNADTTAGATLEDTAAWVTRTSATDAVTLQVDIEYQLYNQRGEGSPSLTVAAEYRAVGSGAWLPWRTETYRNATTEVRRATWTRQVTRGQYEVRMRRTNGANEENVTRSVQWASLRSVQPDETDYSGWGRIGIRIKATGQLNGSLDTVRATFKPRPLPVWNGSAWINATTRPGVSNPGALILLVLRGIWDGDVLQFGYGLSDDQIDVEGLKGFMLHCAAMGFTYDRWITESISLGSLLDEIALAGLGQFMWLDGSRPTVMWAADDQPISGVVNMANMARGSFSVDYSLAEAADGIEYQYVDRARDFETSTLRVMAPGVTTMLKPARVTGEGVTTEAQAAVLARYHLAQSLYQYKEISFGADLERLDYRRMSMLSLSHDMTQWGYGGRLVAAAMVGGNVVLTLDEPVPSLPSRFVGLRIPGERDYRVFGVQAFAGPSDTITLTTAASAWPAGVAFPGAAADNPAHDTLWCYDVKATPGYRVRVVGIEPDSDLKGATVRVVPESSEFWDYVLTGSYVPAPNESLIPERAAPAILHIRVQSQINRQGGAEWAQLNVVWESTGDMGHAQVWAAIDGQPLRMVDGQALGNRSSFRIDENGSWLIQVRPFDSAGKGGAPASALFAADAINRPPLNVDTFAVDEVAGGLRRYRFGYSGTSPSAYAGVRIRYRAGSTPIVAADWDSLTPLGAAGDIYTQAAESTLPAAGTWTFAARSISTAGVLSSSVRSVTVTLGSTFGNILDPELTPAPTPTGANVSAGFASLFFEHDFPTYTQGHGHGKTRVYGVVYTGGAEPVISSAVVLTEFTGTAGSYPTALGKAWRIWIKWVSKDGVESITAAGGSGTNGMAVTTGKIGNADIAPLAVAAAQLANDAVDLGGSKVTGTITDPARFGAAAIGYTVTQYLVATSGVMGNLVVDNGQIASLSVAKLLAGSLGVSQYIQSVGYTPGPSGTGYRLDRDNVVLPATSIRGQLTATQINANGLSIRKADGSLILDASGTGTPIHYSNVLADGGWLNSNQQWTDVAGRPKTYRVAAQGLSASGMPAGAGLSDADANAVITGAGAMYRVVKINRTTKAVTDLGAFNPLSGALGPVGECNAMAAALNTIDSGHICVVFTFDEPLSNRLLGNLPAAMYRNGASKAVWGSPAFQYRGAYILIGIGGCGEGNGAEVYAGAVSSDVNAWCDTTFQITNTGALIVSGASRGATTLLDLDYVGDRDATRGAPAGTYVGSNLAQDLETLAGAQAKADAAANSATSAAATYAAAVADLARINAQAHADNIVDAEETRAIADASNKAEAARAAAVAAAAADATAKADVAALTANWSGVTGPGKPQDNATVGATIGINLAGDFTQESWDVVMGGRTLIRAAHIQQLTANNLTVDALSRTVNGQVSGSPSGARVEITANRVSIYNSSNAERVRLSA